MGIDGRSADNAGFEIDGKAVKLRDLLEHLGALAHYLRADAVAG